VATQVRRDDPVFALRKQRKRIQHLATIVVEVMEPDDELTASTVTHVEVNCGRKGRHSSQTSLIAGERKFVSPVNLLGP
jgi:hypothetical protein